MPSFAQPAARTDTIVAESTPHGSGALAVVRLSGPAAGQVLAQLTPGAKAPPSHRLVRRLLRDAAGAPLDDALAVHMHAPRSYTGEQVVELHLHGSPAVVDAVLAACLAAGARTALPGEFTRRAFLNGRLDLSQAEAVGALVRAEDDAQRRAALRLLKGQRGLLAPWVELLEGVAAAWRAALDFPDEVDEADGLPAALQGLGAAQQAFAALLARAEALRPQPVQVVLMGPVNAGKSTLLNALAGEERALVDASAGTTRDALALTRTVAGRQVVFWDTAGLRAAESSLEARGIALGQQRAETADVILWLTGGQAPAQTTDDLLPPLPESDGAPAWLAKVAVVGSQADIVAPAAQAALTARVAARGLPFVGFVSAPSGAGLPELLAWLAARLAPADTAAGAGVVLALRHRTLLQEAQAALVACLDGAAAGLPLDCQLAEVELALARLGEILGRDVDAQVLDRIFADFCLGK